MPPPRRAGRSAPPGFGRPNDPPIPSDWFPVALTGTTTLEGVTAYTGYEVWLTAAGATAEVVSGRVLSAAQPGVSLDGTEFDLGEDGSGGGDPPLALARMGPGAGGALWELVAFGRSADGADDGPATSDACRGPLAGLRTTDCLSLQVLPYGETDWDDADEFGGAWDADESGWIGDEYVATADGDTRLILFRRTEGGKGLRLEGETETWYADDVGCVGGYLEFAAPYTPPGMEDDGSGSGSGEEPDDACEDQTFRVRVKCGSCNVSTVCCPGGIPRELCVAVSPRCAGCADTRIFTVVYNSAIVLGPFPDSPPATAGWVSEWSAVPPWCSVDETIPSGGATILGWRFAFYCGPSGFNGSLQVKVQITLSGDIVYHTIQTFVFSNDEEDSDAPFQCSPVRGFGHPGSLPGFPEEAPCSDGGEDDYFTATIGVECEDGSGSGGGEEPITDCPTCPEGAAASFAGTLSGFEGGTDINGAISLEYSVGSPCSWIGYIGDAGVTYIISAGTLTFSSGPTYQLSSGGPCCGELVFALVDQGTYTAAPATITLTGVC